MLREVWIIKLHWTDFLLGIAVGASVGVAVDEIMRARRQAPDIAHEKAPRTEFNGIRGWSGWEEANS